jgi:hypothetical protein
LTLRQLWVRLQALPQTSPFHLALRAQQEESEAASLEAEVESTLARFKT